MADAVSSAGIRTIVVGTDFSDASRLAVDAAADIARSHGAVLLLVHAVDPMIATLEISPLTIMEDVREGMKQAAASLQAKGVNVLTQVRLGKSWWAINEAAKETAAELVVVASHGRSGLAKLALGSTADRIVQMCTSPVLLIPVRRGDGLTHSPPSTWRTALIGVDFSEESRLAASMAAELLKRSAAPNATLTLFHTVMLTIEFGAAEGVAALPGHWDQTERTAREQLDRLAASMRTPKLNVETVTHRGYAPDGILSEARRRRVDFVAVGTHGRGAINRVLLGSVAERVVHHSEFPVLTVRHTKAADSGLGTTLKGSTIFKA